MPSSVTYTLKAVGSTPVVPVTDDMLTRQQLPAAVICILSDGSDLTYTVEVTGDNTQDHQYSADSGNWAAMDQMADLTVSANATLTACITGLRVRVSNYTSGTLTVQFVWPAIGRS